MQLKSDINHSILESKPRINISSLLCCSAGGIPACSFTLGAIQRQVETGKFYRHDVISSTSGSTLVCILIEHCYDQGLVDQSSSAWYIAHVVRPIDRILGEQTLSGLWIERLGQSMMSLLPRIMDDLLKVCNTALFGGSASEHWLPNKTRYKQKARTVGKSPGIIVKRPLFLYNYVNVDTGFIHCGEQKSRAFSPWSKWV